MQVYHRHVKAHTGHPLNELADTAAKAAARDSTLDFQPDGGRLQTFWNLHPEVLPWLWMMHGRSQPGAPLVSDHGFLTFPSVSNVSSVDCSRAAATMQRGKATGDSESVVFDIHCASYNALSLLDEGGSLSSDVGKIGLLRHMVHREAVHLLGIQEARTKEGFTASSTHIRISSGATNAGQLGVELWISRLRPYAVSVEGEKKYFFRPADCHVVANTTRYLLVHIHTQVINFYVGVVHAPHSHDPEGATWWAEFSESLSVLVHPTRTVLLIDANARISDELPPHTGDLEVEKPNKATHLLYVFGKTRFLCPCYIFLASLRSN